MTIAFSSAFPCGSELSGLTKLLANVIFNTYIIFNVIFFLKNPLRFITYMSRGNVSPAHIRDKSKWIFKEKDNVEDNIRVKYDIGKQLGQPGQFGTAWECTRKSDRH